MVLVLVLTLLAAALTQTLGLHGAARGLRVRGAAQPRAVQAILQAAKGHDLIAIGARPLSSRRAAAGSPGARLADRLRRATLGVLPIPGEVWI